MALSAVARLARVELRSRDPDALAAFYREALGASESIALVATGDDAMPYPGDVPGWSPVFQHCALRVLDMDAAHARLLRAPRWRPISRDGPERLPPRSGGVRAFKFRDPEGHPLELLSTDAASSGTRDDAVVLDHSAISVVHVERSIAFYETLGLTVRARSFNEGIEQDRLDDVSDARVDVVSLGVGDGEPHLELLGYRDVRRPATAMPAPDDVAATRLVFEVDERDSLRAHARTAIDRAADRVLLRDPDGHLVALVLSTSAR